MKQAKQRKHSKTSWQAAVLVLMALAGLNFAWADSSTPGPASLRAPLGKPLPFVVSGKTETPPAQSKSDLALQRQTILQHALPTVDVMMNQETFHLEVARTYEEQRLGLMFRESLAPRQGMIFPFSPARGVNFWMKNCKIALDMIFIRKGAVVHVVEGAPPCQQEPCPTFDSIYPIDTVIELAAGSAKQYKIAPGVRVQLVSRPPVSQPAEGSAPEASSNKQDGTSSEK